MLQNHQQIQEIYDYISYHWSEWFPDLPTYQAFNHRLNNLSASFAVIADLLLQAKVLSTDANFSADSTEKEEK